MNAEVMPSPSPAEAATCRRLADEVEDNLRRHVLGKWFPQAVDRERGGFHQNFREDWTRSTTRNEKSLVYQSRLSWLATQAARRYPAEAEAYLGYARHGLDFLAGVLWDPEHGGFFWAVDENGRPNTERGVEKHVYGIAFGIYAAAAASDAAAAPDAGTLARRAFDWLDERAHDAENGGYFEALTRDGKPILTSPSGGARLDAIGTRYGFKSMNSHIHLLEAFTALHEVSPDDATLRTRLRETFELVRDKIAVAPGCLNLFFTPDWRAVPDHDSFGHDVETAFLLAEAAAALGVPDDARTWAVARSLVDHALDTGWDGEYGGFFEKGSAFGPATDTTKVWWTQAEGLNALLQMHERFGRETSRYWDAFTRQWNFIRTRQTDPRHGGWFPAVRRDGAPVPGRPKSDAWTEGYHQGRALLNVSAVLRRLAE